MTTKEMKLPDVPTSSELEQLRSKLATAREDRNTLDQQRRELIPRLKEAYDGGKSTFNTLLMQRKELDSQLEELNQRIALLREQEQVELDAISVHAKAALREAYHEALEVYADALQHAIEAQVGIQGIVAHAATILAHRHGLPGIHNYPLSPHFMAVTNYLENQQ